ncbi:C2 domain-containing protein At1g53590-like [Olea europaea var. sylvestris]|uniref:C2 domain-containing protein At1g53590-like n=1 Tax=Olea europaea var. sylvestris TaxID=158386 RepID=UPI000C1D38BA|nr:C2 domain-containing protein At1g53590-like [Olea europaea var. sylvestris]
MGSILEVTIIHHVCMVLIFFWLLNSFKCCHPVAYFLSLIYLYLVHELYETRWRRKLQFDEIRQSNRRWKDTAVQRLYLGRSLPIFTEMRVLPKSHGDDHLVLELGTNFRTADDMGAIIAVKLRKRLGLGMRAKLHLLGMHVEGNVSKKLYHVVNNTSVSASSST